MKKTTKKLLAVIVLIVLLLSSLMVSSQAADPQYLTMNSVSGNVNQQVTVELKAKTDLEVDVINVVMPYDTTKLSITENDIKLPATLRADLGIALDNYDFMAMKGIDNSGNITLAILNNANVFTVKAGTTLMTMTFTILEATEVDNPALLSAEVTIGNGSSENNKTEEVTATVTGKQPVTGISLDQTAETLTVGDSRQLNATVTPANATDKTVTWTSNDETVARVENGLVEAVGLGTATITATAGDYSATYTVTVDKSPLKGIELSDGEAKLLKGQTKILTVTITPADTTDDTTATWTSSDETVARVENGTVEAVGKGTATITVQVGKYIRTCDVTVTEVPLDEIGIDSSNFELEEGASKQLGIIFNPNDTTDDKTATWTSSDETVATVENGLVKAVGKGTATITATVNGKEATVEVTVTEKVIEDEKDPEGVLPEVGDAGIDQEEEKEEEKTPVLPATGDIAIGFFVVLMVISVVGIAFIVKRNRK